MQEMQRPDGTTMREIFAKYETGPQLQQAMNERRTELEAHGYKFVKRAKVGRNVACPCGSGAKFKRCCITKFEGVHGGARIEVLS